ncbi:mandelate racemase/muconate lactonizing enzyme family protein [Phycisphaerales bacterium AB-hyl4]|uniref:Mandelate racemase/muconate lactonizing enzyme family protein n=1 Tax=Natronomicrosphaera hydrolytica TaxID=3242702 RepID=A0ABV4UAX2_9BACT
MNQPATRTGAGLVVAAVRCHVCEHALRPEVVIRSHAGVHDRSRYLLVELVDADGCQGWGEAATTPIWSGEWAQTEAELVRGLLAPAIVGTSYEHPSELLTKLDAVCWGHPFTKAAVETAAWDLWARRQQRSVLELVADRPPSTSLPTRASIGAYPLEQTLRMATEFHARGIRCLKFKVGLPGVDDAVRLRAVREAVGSDVVFTLDANGGYPSADVALRALETMLPVGIALLEQPTPRDRLDLLAAVRRHASVPVMADEAIFTADQLAMALDLDAFDVLSVYPGKNGGFSNALAMARTAAAAGKGCAVGSNLETDVGLAAMTTLAAGCKAFDVERWPGDFASSLYYTGSAVHELLALEDGRIAVPDGPGFGVEPRL